MSIKRTLIMRILKQIKKVCSEFIALLKEEQRKEMEALRMGKDYIDEDYEDPHDLHQSSNPASGLPMCGAADAEGNTFGYNYAYERYDDSLRRSSEEYYESYNRFPQ